MSELGVHRGLWFALELDGRGGARAIDGDALVQAQPTWIHLDPRAPETIGWLREHAGLSDTELERLLADDRRTRLEPFREDCFVLALRGLAPEVDGDPRELPLARFWIQPGRLISFAVRELPGVTELRRRYREGRGSPDISGILAWMAARLGNSFEEHALALEDEVTELEYLAEGERESPAEKVRAATTHITRLRRHASPFGALVSRALAWIDAWPFAPHAEEWQRIHDQAQSTSALLENLHDRARSLHDYLDARLSARMNAVLYVLTLLSTILLPLTFVTGLLGMNVGITGGSYAFLESRFAFVGVSAVLVVLGCLLYLVIRKQRLLENADRWLNRPSRNEAGPAPGSARRSGRRSRHTARFRTENP